MIKIITLFFLIISIQAYAQDYGKFPILKKEKLHRDLELLYQGLEKLHSGMYWYTSKDSVKKAFDNAKAAINKDMNVLHFHKIIAPLVALSNEDHTDIDLPKSIISYMKTEAKYMPLLVVFLGDDLYVLRNASNKELDIVGKKIVSINGLKPLDIVDKIGALFASDGYIQEVKKSDLRSFNFARYYYYYFGNLDSYTIQLTDSLIELSTLKKEDIIKNLKSQKTKKKTSTPKKECLEFKLINDSTAYLAVHDFDNGVIKENKVHNNYKTFLSNSFTEIKKLDIKHLILDISKNGGGSEGNENLLYSYLGDKYQKYIKVKAKTRKTKLDNGIDKPITLKSFGLLQSWLFNNKMKDGSYERKQNRGFGLMAYKKEPKVKFKGSLYVLIGPITYSGASEIANMLYTNNIGAFIGQETGGGYYGNTSGYGRTLILPHSKIEIEIPVLQFMMNVNDSIPFGRGVIPHHHVIPTFKQIAKGENAYLTYALNLIEGNK